MIEKIRRYWRRIIGRKMIKSVVPVEGFDQVIDFRGVVKNEGGEIPPEVRSDLGMGWQFLLGKILGTIAPHEPACPQSVDGFHCSHWHFGRRECCYCGLADPEERDPLRREISDGP